MNSIAPLPRRYLFAILCHVALFFALLVQCLGQVGDETEAPYFLVNGNPAGVDELPLKGFDASIEIVDTLALVEIVQTFANVGPQAIEAVYVFPGSTRAAVSGLEMRVGDRVVEAVIKKKAEARQTYEEAKSEGKTASLLEQHKPNVFQMNLANILPGDVVEVKLRYTEWVRREKSDYEFALPLVVGPRFSEGGQAWVENPLLAPEEEAKVRYEISAKVLSAVTLEKVSCESHEAEVVFDTTRSVSVHVLGDSRSVGNRDFRLKYRVSGDEVKSGALISESNGEKYFMATLEPPVLKGNRKRMPREYFFIVDVSGSMGGFPLETAKEMMGALVARLDAEDRFNLMLFSGDSKVFAPVSVSATEENLVEAVRFLFEERGGGGTRLLPALRRVYDTPRDLEFSRSIVVLTDGYVTVEEQVFDLIRERLDEASVFACGIGKSPNRLLIEGMAKIGQGEPFFVTKASEAKEVADRFSEYVSEPVLSQLKIAFEGVEIFDVEPVSLPDLLAERPVVVFGKYTGSFEGRFVLSGRAGESVYEEAIDLSGAVNLAGSRSLEYVWARERIGRLSDYSQFWGNEERSEEVTQLGLKHSLLTKFTSFVAVDRVVRKLDDGETPQVKQPLPLPEGMNRGIMDGGNSVPVTPEPEMWALMGCVFVALTWILIRRGV